MAERYFGEEQGRAWVEQVRGMFPAMVRILVRPEWVGLLDFEGYCQVEVSSSNRAAR